MAYKVATKLKDPGVGQSMDTLRVQSFQFIMRFLEEGHLPVYPGSVLRGAFGHIFRRTVCVTGKSVCQGCTHSESCAYSYVFETPTPPDTKRMRLYPFVPHPFVLEPPLLAEGGIQKDQTVEHRLILIGRGIEFFPYFLFTIIEMGKAGLGKRRIPFVVQKVLDQNGRTIYEERNETIQQLPVPYEIPLSSKNDLNGRSMTIEFNTPLRMTYQNKPAKDFIFPAFVGTMLRRISSLAFFHHGFEPSLSFKTLVEEASMVEVIKEKSYYQPFRRYSARQKREMDLGGTMGRFTLLGDLSPFASILRAGEVLHVGKGTAFGLGKYKIVGS